MDMMKRRRAMMGAASRLPAGYKEISYIESDGTQTSIPTGINSASNREMETVFEIPTITNLGACIGAGGADLGAYRFYPFGVVYSDNGNYYAAARFGGGSINSTGGIGGAWVAPATQQLLPNIKHKFISTYRGTRYTDVILDDDTKFTKQWSSALTGGKQIYLFKSSDTLGAVFRLYSFKMRNYTTRELLMDLVPCIRMNDNKPGVFDLARNAFLTSEGANYITP